MATDDMQRLIVALEARTRGFENALNKANGVANSRARAIESRFARLNANVGNTMAGVGKRWIAGLVAAFGARELTQLSDAATKIDNALKIAGLSGVELEGVYGKLRDSAVKNAAPLEALVELYSRAALVQKDLGKSSEELTTFADKVAVALRVGGRSAAESSGALLQLSQALGEGVVRAQEFNSIIEGAPALLQAAAAGIKQADGSVAKLRAIMLEGGLSSKAFFDGIIAGAPLLEDKVANAEYTVSQAMGNLRTGLIDAAREFNNTTGASGRLAGGINNVAEAITDLDVTGFIEKIQSAQGAFEQWAESVGNSDVFMDLAKTLGVLNGEGLVVNLDKEAAEAEAAALQREVETLQEKIKLNTEMGFDNTEALARLGEVSAALAAVTAQAAGMPDVMSGAASSPSGLGAVYTPSSGPSARNGPRRKVAIDAIDLDDDQYKPPPGKKKKGKKSDPFKTEIQQTKERTATLLAETAAQAKLNPLINDYEYASTKAKSIQELLNAAQKAGLIKTAELSAANPKLRESILSLAEGYAQATAASNKLSESQEQAKAIAEDFKSLGKDALGGFIKDLQAGKSATEALANALSKVGDKLLDLALDSAFGLGNFKGTGKSGGFLGGILGGIGKLFGFAQGGYTGNGGKNEPAGIVHKGEYVMDAATTKRIGVRNLRRLQGYSSGGLVGSAPALPTMAPRQPAQGGSIAVSVTTEVQNGNLVPLVTAVAGQVAGRQIKQVNRNIQGRLQTVSSRGV